MDQNPILFNIADRFEARWYGLCFALAFVIGQIVITRIFKAEGKTEKQVESLTLYMIVVTVIGARLGHCLFYEPAYYLSHPVEILKVWKGGLASHGATIGIIAGLYFWSRKEKTTWLWILDRIVIVVALGGMFIRLGNLMNSEIVGKPTDAPWGFVFSRAGHEAIDAARPQGVGEVSFSKTDKHFTTEGGDPRVLIKAQMSAPQVDPRRLMHFAENQLPQAINDYNEAHEHIRPGDAPLAPNVANGALTVDLAGVPRHPAQLYEALSCLVIFLSLYAIWARYTDKLPEGRLFGAFVVILFSLRFAYEFLKENQVEFENELPLNMGQWLSIPLVLAGFYILARSFRLQIDDKTGDAIS